MSDDIVKVDLSGYRERVGAQVPPGRYRVRVTDTEKDKSKAQNDMINLWLQIVGGEFDGRVLVDRLVLTEKSLFRVVGFMQAIGIPTPRKSLQVNISQWRGKVLEVDVEDGEPYNGRVKSEVRGYVRIKSAATAKAAAAPVDVPDDLAELDEPATTGAAVESTTAPAAPAAPAAAAASASAGNGSAAALDDLPEDIDLAELDL